LQRAQIRRWAVRALVVLLLLMIVNRLRDGGSPGVAEAPPIAATPTTAYVPAAVRGDALPVVVAPSGISVSRGGSVWRGVSLSAPGAKPDDVIGVFLMAPAASITLEPRDGVKLYPLPTPAWLYFEGNLAAVNAALAAVHYRPVVADKQEVMVSLLNNTLHTNPRSVTLPVQVT
jgi:hypothetical protein